MSCQQLATFNKTSHTDLVEKSQRTHNTSERPFMCLWI